MWITPIQIALLERKRHTGTVFSIYNNAATTAAPMVAATVVAVATEDPLSSTIPSEAVGSVTAKSSVSVEASASTAGHVAKKGGDIDRGGYEGGINRVPHTVRGVDVGDDHVGIVNHHGTIAHNLDGDVLTIEQGRNHLTVG